MALILHFKGLLVKPRALTYLAGDIDIRQKMHLDFYQAVSPAGLAPPALDVETKPARPIAAQLRFR